MPITKLAQAASRRRIIACIGTMLGAVGCAALLPTAGVIAPALMAPAAAQQPAAGSSVWSPPQRRRIVLMRHGDVAYFDAAGKPVADPDKVVLSEKGRAQADAAGAHLRAIGFAKFDRVISSDLPRTIETARRAIAAGRFEGSPTEIGALREMRNGSTRSIATPDLPAALLALSKPRTSGDSRFIGGESVAELQARIALPLKALLDDKGWDTALLVLHALVNNAILSSALTGDSTWYGRFDHGPACFAIIDVGADFSDAVIKTVNACGDPSPYASRLTTSESLLSQALKGR